MAFIDTLVRGRSGAWAAATDAPARAHASGTALEVQSVSKSFGGVAAVHDVSLSVEAGEICAIIGPNGAGKSTLLNLMSGLIRPDAGSIAICGERVEKGRGRNLAARGVQRTFQHLALFEGLNVGQNVALACRAEMRAGLFAQTFGSPRARREARDVWHRVSEVLAFLHLETHQSADIRTLPYGVRKRVELARALVARPRLLLLDEPMAGLGVEDKAHLADFIRRTVATLGTTIVLIEHDIGLVTSLASRLVVLDHGRKIADGTPDEVKRDATVIDAYLGVDHLDGAHV